MNFYLLCPSKPNIENDIVYGQTDLDVSSSFHEDCLKLLPQIAGLPVKSLFSSTMKRSFKLASTISDKLKLPLTADERLIELNYGIWEMERWDAIPPTDLNIWMVDFVNLKTPGGESFLELFRRVSAFLKSMDISNTLILSHSGVMRIILCYFLNIPLNDCFKVFDIQCCRIYKVDTSKPGFDLL